MTFPRTFTGFGWSTDDDEDDSDSCRGKRTIIVANFLPLLQTTSEETGKWCFRWDEDSLLLQMKDGFSADTEVVYVGRLKVDIDCKEQEEVVQKLFKDYRCVPTFIDADAQEDCYHGFCKQQLWPLFHNMLPMFKSAELVDTSPFTAYIKATNVFADKVMEAIRSKDDCVWVHDYHLMLLPTFLRKRVHCMKLGFFLHCPFPSVEIYKTLPSSTPILRGLLNADLIGFHTFDYARNFISCCRWMLGLEHECSRGYLSVKYCGRAVIIKILPIGVHVGRIQSVLNLPVTISKVREIEQKYRGKKLVLGVDDMDIFKGIGLKLEGLELLMERCPALRGQVVLVQILNPARTTGKDVTETRTEAIKIADRINAAYGHHNYKPVVLIEGSLPSYEKIAYYVAGDCCIVNSLRDGMNLIPYEYVVCRQGTVKMDRSRGIQLKSPHTSTLVVSESIGCSPYLSGAFRVNPWDVEDIADALYRSILMSGSEKQLRHEKHYRYVSSHDIAYWSNSFMQHLERASKDHFTRTYWPLGLGLDFRVLVLDPSFQKLSIDRILQSYQRASRRIIFLDYDGTLVPKTSISNAPRTELISILHKLSSDRMNTVFIVSGRDRTSLGEWFSQCEELGIAAEHGYFIR